MLYYRKIQDAFYEPGRCKRRERRLSYERDRIQLPPGMMSSDTTGDTGGNSRLSSHANCIATPRGKYRGERDPLEVARNILHGITI